MGVPSRRAAALGLLALLAAGCLAPLPTRPYPPVVGRPADVDVLDYEIELDLHHEAGWVEGQVSVEFAAPADRPARQLVLDAVDLVIESAHDGLGRALPFERTPATVRVQLAEPLAPGAVETVTLRYAGFPARGIHFVPPRDGRPWHVWTQGQSEDTRHWVPVRDAPDDEATHTLHLTVDDQLATMAAGRLVHSWTNPHTGRRTETWRMDTPHVPYLIPFVAGGFGVGEVSGGTVPLPFLADPADLEAARENLSATPQMLAFLEEWTGRPYPFPKYAQTFVHDFTAGGMENISATTLYYEGLRDPSDRPPLDLEALLMHEAAHQWFGDLVACRGWTHLWLNEGFAQYCEALWVAHREGRERMGVLLQDYQRQAMAAELDQSRPIVWNDWSDPDELYGGHAYEGAAARLHLLSAVLGEEAFAAGVRLHVQRHEQGLADTDDLRAVFEQASGRDLSRFFDEWFRSPGFPRFEVELLPSSPSQPVARLVARQTQGKDGWLPTFHVPVGVSWAAGGREHRGQLTFEESVAELPLTGEGPLEWVRFDADGVVPGLVLLTQSEEAWARQLASASDGTTRLLAAQWFAGDPWVTRRDGPQRPLAPESLQALLQAARADALVDVRISAVQGLAELDDPHVGALLLELADDRDPRVRAAALSALGSSPDDDALACLSRGAEDDNAHVAFAALAALVRAGHPESLERVLDLARSTPKVRLARDLVRLAGEMDDPAVLPFLMGLARSHHERWVRAAAVQALAARASPHAEATFRQLCASLHDSSYQVRAAAALGLGQSIEPRARRQLQARRDIEVDPVVLDALDEALAGSR